jgi:type II secretory pathway pseudopilin PulG
MHFKNIALFKTLLSPKKLKIDQANAGFTMIELLVGAILAFLIISPLMGFVVSILNDDKRESAKTASDQEIQAALDYITEDLNQAIYIYDREGVVALNNNDGIAKDSKTPILAFWKRAFARRVLPVFDGATCPDDCDDTFVYSLVVYYVTQDGSQIWNENTARIERMEISNGVRNPFSGEFVEGYRPDDAYNDFDSEDWNAWTKADDLPGVQVLVDYIDASADIEVTDADCTSALGVVDDNNNPNNPQLISDKTLDGDNGDSSYGFYACVDTLSNIVQVNLRGNALERIDPGAEYNANRQAFFPTGSVVIRGLGGFGE